MRVNQSGDLFWSPALVIAVSQALAHAWILNAASMRSRWMTNVCPARASGVALLEGRLDDAARLLDARTPSGKGSFAVCKLGSWAIPTEFALCGEGAGVIRHLRRWAWGWCEIGPAFQPGTTTGMGASLLKPISILMGLHGDASKPVRLPLLRAKAIEVRRPRYDGRTDPP
ncbi:MAG: hypothetical protein M9895_08940 [Aquamicrobium sp.]|uniref:hypothetical protein n=1 Tax=Aquamicrobium sp. TaxID=1872579 RepID=UPI00349E9271|nr:hypothetical protein [Aquamicrobium sp.]